jgi:DNA-binding transcriptional LysR family regulator
MQLPDMNLLPALDALLREASVTGAATELTVSASAMSRTLARLRRVVGDPLLVPAGRGLTLTPRARELQPRVEAALADALAALQPRWDTDIAEVTRDFAIRTNDSVAVAVGAALTGYAAREAPGIRLRILPEGDEDPADLRDRIDLDVGAMPELPPDVRSSPLGEYYIVAVARADGPYVQGPLTPARFAEIPHVTVSRRGLTHSVVDELLAAQDLRRRVLATVPSASAACFFALEADVLALVSANFAARAASALPLVVFDIPLSLPPTQLAQAWHLRLHADPAHRWLRRTVAKIVTDDQSARDQATSLSS